MSIIKSLIIAFAMYSKIPMPVVEWKKENMRYAMCFFPAVGAVIGGCICLIGCLFSFCQVGGLLRGAVYTVVPILISGGIHMDGFMDTMDAKASYGDREKKLEILKDSHAGAFAILGLGCYLLLSTAVWSEMPDSMLPFAGMVYVLSRAFSGLSVVCFQAARNSGLLKTFQDHAQKRAVGMTMCGYIAVCAGIMSIMNWKTAIAVFLPVLAVFFYYRRLSYSQFGGITGDLAGYFLQVSELAMLAGIMIAGGGLWS